MNMWSMGAYLSSYDPGSAGWSLLIHEIGHTLGLKHPHDDGGTGRPTFLSLNINTLDIDIATVMSYKDGADWNLIQWDPATPMILDVLAIQYLYEKNLSTHAGNTNHKLFRTNFYGTLWDASGDDTIELSSDVYGGWTVELPSIGWSKLVDTKVGLVVPSTELAQNLPKTLFWLAGDYENVVGSSYSDNITGNQFNNKISSDGGNDTIVGGGGNDTIDGGEGSFDTLKLSGSFSDYIFFTKDSFSLTVSDNVADRDGEDLVRGVELFQFSDITKRFAELTQLKRQVKLSALTDTIHEGKILAVSISVQNSQGVKSLPYLIEGISKNDLVGGALSGVVSLDSNGIGQILLNITEDKLTEGDEVLSLSVDEQRLLITISDTSLSLVSSNGSVLGTDSGEVISGNDSPQTIYGFGGDDLITKSYAFIKNDLIYGGDGNDTIQSGGGIDTVFGGDGDDEIWIIGKGGRFLGEAGADEFVFDLSEALKLQDGNFYVDGGAGLDTAKLAFSSYSSSVNRGENLAVNLSRGSVQLTLVDVERLESGSDGLAFDVQAAAGQAYRIYRAAFDRTPDGRGLGYWIKQIDGGMALEEAAKRFIESPEFRSLYGQNPTNAEFLTKVYSNVLDRNPDQAGLDWWVNEMTNNPAKTWQKVLADFSESTENQANVVSLIANGITYQVWVG